MDFLKTFTGSSSKQSHTQGQGQPAKKDDFLDKAVDMFQDKVLKQGSQKNESAAEQAKDEKISNGIRSLYKSVSGKEFPIKDKK